MISSSSTKPSTFPLGVVHDGGGGLQSCSSEALGDWGTDVGDCGADFGDWGTDGDCGADFGDWGTNVGDCGAAFGDGGLCVGTCVEGEAVCFVWLSTVLSAPSFWTSRLACLSSILRFSILGSICEHARFCGEVFMHL